MEGYENQGSAAEGAELIFYDGACGLCHGAVSFLLKRDTRHGREPTLLFAPLQGETFLERVPLERRNGLPDSLIMLTQQGDLLTRSRAVLEALRHLPQPWRGLAAVGRVIPVFLLDLGYRLVARLRARLFAKPDSLCPLLPPHLRRRFLP